jgi:AcrR family transcriptional regulator
VDAKLEQAPRPLRRDAERNRQRILAAARVLIAEQGLGVSHDQLAEAADVAVGTVYRRFPDKESLIDALFTEKMDDVVDSAKAALSIADPWQALVTFMVSLLQLHARNRGLKELSLGTTRGMALACRSQEQLEPVVAELIDRCHQAKVLREGISVPDVVLISVMVGAVMDTAGCVDPDLWRRSLAIALDGLRACNVESLPGLAPTFDQLNEIMCNWRPPAR